MFGHANENAADLTTFEDRSPVTAVRYIRKLRGGSQASLIECSDGSAYVVKMNGNPQGPNILANEVIGAYVAASLGLPVAAIRSVIVTEAFLNSNPRLAFEAAAESYSALPGTHLGISFIGDLRSSSSVFQVLTSRHISRVVNRECFLGMYLLDIAANHQDHRQALFVREGDIFTLRTVFIDHGQMFGGPRWNTSAAKCLPLHRNASLYLGLWNELDVSNWITKLQKRVPATIEQSIPTVPKGWFDGSITVLRDAVLRRVDQLPRLVRQYRLSEAPKPASIPKEDLTRGLLWLRGRGGNHKIRLLQD